MLWDSIRALATGQVEIDLPSLFTYMELEMMEAIAERVKQSKGFDSPSGGAAIDEVKDAIQRELEIGSAMNPIWQTPILSARHST